MSEDNKKDPNSLGENFKFEQASSTDDSLQELHDQLQREKEEPSEGFAPLPLFMVTIIAALCFWAGVEITTKSAKFRWDVYDPNYVESAEPAGPVVYDPIAHGRRVYNTCVACHQAEGQGVPGAFPPLAGSDWVGMDPVVLSKIVINGLAGPIEVNGVPYNGIMAALGPTLDDEEVAAVLSYIRQSWGNDYGIVEESLVASVRADFGGRAEPWTAEELFAQ